MESKFSNIVDMKAGRVYRETTLPQPANKTKPPWASRIARGIGGGCDGIDGVGQKETKEKKVRRDKSDLGEHFIAPDGGWAWIVCIAAGISNLSIYPCLQQFGFIFRERMTVLGLSSSQITTIINTNPAISACTGLLNGPMFRRFTFRQVAMAGSLCIFSGIMLTAFCDTFLSYMFSYALLFGFGMGISVSASSLAINTYFKNKRRRAAGFSWTITGVGPIFLPYFVTFLLAIYGVQGTVLIFAALSLHTMACALIYQPVRYHAPTGPKPHELSPGSADPEHVVDAEYRCKYCELQQKKEFGIFSSQYLYQDDDEDKPGYEIIEPGTPMLSRANDGWFGSRLSLASNRNSVRFRTVSSSLDVGNKLNKVSEEEMRKLEEEKQQKEAEEAEEEVGFLKPNNFRRERDEVCKRSNSRGNLRLQFGRSDSSQQMRCTCAEEKVLMELNQMQSPTTPTPSTTTRLVNGGVPNFRSNNNLAGKQLTLMLDTADGDEISSQASVTFMQKVVAFFDLDLLRDFTFVNLVAGLTIINFGELNFSILTPFILNDFGFDTPQITLAMSVLAGLDITVRFLVPFFTEKIPWDNRVFFLIGVVGIALGRTVVACTRSYPLILACFVWIGMCKGVRTIFWPLIIPGYVPLKRLPAASGLQLLISGLFTLGAGPFVGLVRDRYDYSVTLHCLNMMSFIAAISWTSEALVRRYYRRRRRTSVDREA